MAHYLALLVYRMLTKGQAWVDRGAAQFEQKRTERELSSLKSKALAWGSSWFPSPKRSNRDKRENRTAPHKAVV